MRGVVAQFQRGGLKEIRFPTPLAFYGDRLTLVHAALFSSFCIWSMIFGIMDTNEMLKGCLF